MTNTPFTNDLDSGDPDTIRWELSDSQETVEERRYSIRVYDLKEKWEWISRNDLPNPRSFLLGKVEVKPMKDNDGWYLDLVDTGPHCSNTAITIIHTRCNYGGYREWFECQQCHKRSGVLYRDRDQFKCRKCLKLIYFLQKTNGLSIVRTIEHMNKLDKMKENKKRYFYAGKDTKWFKKYKELHWKVNGAMALFNKKHLKDA